MGVGAVPVFSFFAVCAPHGFRDAESLGKYGPRCKITRLCAEGIFAKYKSACFTLRVSESLL